jgi:AcrR family transcriptional regulator
MKTDDTSMRKKIIAAAVECIEKFGLNGLTVRRIAKEAKVNIAAINYYFGSKDRLIDELIKQTLYTGFEENINDFLIKYKETPHKALELFFLEIMGGGLRYPNLIKIHFYEAFVNNNYKTISVKKVNSFIHEFEKVVCLLLPQKAKKDCTMDMVQLWSAIFFPIVFPGMMREYAGFDFADPQVQKEYVRKLIKIYFGE